jgi:hypothetical protein
MRANRPAKLQDFEDQLLARQCVKISVHRSAFTVVSGVVHHADIALTAVEHVRSNDMIIRRRLALPASAASGRWPSFSW